MTEMCNSEQFKQKKKKKKGIYWLKSLKSPG